MLSVVCLIESFLLLPIYHLFKIIISDAFIHENLLFNFYVASLKKFLGKEFRTVAGIIDRVPTQNRYFFPLTFNFSP